MARALDAPVYVYSAVASRVIDGDTYFLDIDLGFFVHAVVPIRLLGIDTPELSTPEGKRAAAFVKRTLGKKPLLVKTKKAKDSRDQQTFGRWLAEVWVDGKSLSDILKQHGFVKQGGEPDPDI